MRLTFQEKRDMDKSLFDQATGIFVSISEAIIQVFLNVFSFLVGLVF